MAKRSATSTATGAPRPLATRAKASLPTVTAEKILEDKSRAIFSESVSPWLVTDWSQHDYGIGLRAASVAWEGAGAG